MAGASFLALFDDIALLLDDVAAMTKVSATQTAPVLADDLAVNAQALSGGGIRADRELSIVWQVFRGSMINKLFIVPIALVLSYYWPFIIPILLVLGGMYLGYEGFEKVWHTFRPKHKLATHVHKEKRIEAVNDPEVDLLAFEAKKIKGAIRTDAVLSVEIIVIALGAIQGEPLLVKAITLSVVAILLTVGVYGTVAAIVRADDLGIALLKDKTETFKAKVKRRIGSGLVSFAPKMMKFLTVAGTIAMCLIGGQLVSEGVPFIEHALVSMNSFVADNTLMQTMSSIVLEMTAGLIIGSLVYMSLKSVKWVKGFLVK